MRSYIGYVHATRWNRIPETRIETTRLTITGSDSRRGVVGDCECGTHELSNVHCTPGQLYGPTTHRTRFMWREINAVSIRYRSHGSFEIEKEYRIPNHTTVHSSLRKEGSSDRISNACGKLQGEIGRRNYAT